MVQKGRQIAAGDDLSQAYEATIDPPGDVQSLTFHYATNCLTSHYFQWVCRQLTPKILHRDAIDHLAGRRQTSGAKDQHMGVLIFQFFAEGCGKIQEKRFDAA